MDAIERLNAALAERYRIERQLGAGGMATVYLAEERHPQRHVAIKVLEPMLAAALGPERFLREVDLASKLAHPHILPIYAAAEAGGLLYYVMPYVEGESLRDRLTREKQLPLDDALQITREVADALSYAHSRGVVHRDIKPENILLESGHAVVADFGIARAIDQAGGSRLTETGLTLGTPAYMSPEQAAGSKDLDGRSDLYSLGCVLYEMLGGQPPFAGPTAQVILARKSMEAVPSLRAVRDSVSPGLEATVMKALARVPADRHATAAVFSAALMTAETGAVAPPLTGATAASARRAAARTGFRVSAVRVLPWALVLLVAGAAVWGWTRAVPGRPAAAVTVSTITLPDSAPLAFVGNAPYGIGRTALALSPDGATLAYVAQRGANTQIYLRPLDRDTVIPVPGTEGACCLFFSPDGVWLAFLSGDHLMRVRPWFGGAPVPILDVNGFSGTAGADWGDDGRIVVTDQQGRRTVRLDPETGTRETITPVAIAPKVLPGGRGILAGNQLIIPERHERQTLFASGSGSRYVPTGHLAYVRRSELWAVPFDLGARRVAGEPFMVLPRLRTESYQSGQYTFARNGMLIYASGGSTDLSRLVVHDRAGRLEVLSFDPAQFGCLALSPDGARIAAMVGDPETGRWDLWVYDLAHRNRTRLTTSGEYTCPAWSPDGRVSYLVQSGTDALLVSQSGTGRESPMVVRTLKGTGYRVQAWSSDGKRVVLQAQHDSTGIDVEVLDLAAGGTLHPVAATPALEWGGVFSPNGRWIAYSSNESGADEIYVQPYPPTGQRWRISRAGGEEPLWTRGGTEVVYRLGQEWWGVRVTTAPQFAAGEPELLARGPYANVAGVEYAVSADGNRLYLLEPLTGPSTTTRLTVITNWFTMLKDQARRAKP